MKVLAYTSPARGHLFPTVPILLELQRRGHTVVLRTIAADVPRMRELGFTADPISPEIEAIIHDDYRARTPMKAIGGRSTSPPAGRCSRFPRSGGRSTQSPPMRSSSTRTPGVQL
jgi:hypothetical protein